MLCYIGRFYASAGYYLQKAFCFLAFHAEKRKCVLPWLCTRPISIGCYSV